MLIEIEIKCIVIIIIVKWERFNRVIEKRNRIRYK